MEEKLAEKIFHVFFKIKRLVGLRENNLFN